MQEGEGEEGRNEHRGGQIDGRWERMMAARKERKDKEICYEYEMI